MNMDGNQNILTKQHPLNNYQNQLINNTIGGTTLLDINDINIQNLNTPMDVQSPEVEDHQGLTLPVINGQSNDDNQEQKINQNNQSTQPNHLKRTFIEMNEDSDAMIDVDDDDEDEIPHKKQRLYQLLQRYISQHWSIH